MKKDGRLNLKIDEDLKQKFIIACDGRPMTVVLIKLMEGYINDWNISNNKQEKQ